MLESGILVKENLHKKIYYGLLLWFHYISHSLCGSFFVNKVDMCC